MVIAEECRCLRRSISHRKPCLIDKICRRDSLAETFRGNVHIIIRTKRPSCVLGVVGMYCCLYLCSYSESPAKHVSISQTVVLGQPSDFIALSIRKGCLRFSEGGFFEFVACNYSRAFSIWGHAPRTGLALHQSFKLTTLYSELPAAPSQDSKTLESVRSVSEMEPCALG